eukprot:Polyplicarium_translucidae@DN509_c0_g1_i1.p1
MADMCRVSPLYCHRLFFILETESVPLTKKDGRRVFLDFADHLPAVCKRLQDRALQEMIPFERELFDAQFKFVDQLTRISGELMNVPQTERKTYIRRRCSEVARLTNVAFIYLPTIPRLRITSIAANSGTPMQSAAKAPYLISFHCGQTQEIGYFIEAERRQKLGALTSNDENEEALGLPCDGATKQFSCIVKMGDDLRQDDLALQVIQLCRYIFQQLGSRLWLRPYKVISHRVRHTTKDDGVIGGVIECVPNTMSRHQLGNLLDCSLSTYFEQKFGPPHTPRYQEAQWNFLRSLAAYSVVSFVLQIKDRHNGNLLLDDEGFIMHIDFGFLFDSSPGGDLKFERAPFKLTREMIDIMGGRPKALPFEIFRQLCVQGYLALRHHAYLILALTNMMLESGMPCFRANSLANMRKRLQLDASAWKAGKFMEAQVNLAYNALTTRLYDVVQAIQQGVAH